MGTQFRTRVGPDGRVMIPAALRKELGLTAGEKLVVSPDQDVIHLRTCPMTLDRARRLVARYIPADAYLTARLLPATSAYGLSLGDRACLPQFRGQPALTAEREWDRVDAGVRVVRIR